MQNNNYNISYNDVQKCFIEIFENNPVFKKYKVVPNINPKSDDGKTEIDTYHPVGSIGYEPITVIIGTKSLEEHMLPSGQVRDEDAVWCIMQAFHESAHVWQYSVGYMQKQGSNLTNTMAKDRAIDICFPEYERYAYLFDTTELFADKYAAIQTSAFFNNKSKTNERFANINADYIICEKTKRRRWFAQPIFLDCQKTSDIISTYTRLLDALPYMKRFTMLPEIDNKNKSKNYFKLTNNDSIYNKITNARNGIEQTEILCDYIGTHHPECFRGLLCIQDKYYKHNAKNIINKAANKILRIKQQEWIDINKHNDDTNDYPIP